MIKQIEKQPERPDKNVDFLVFFLGSFLTFVTVNWAVPFLSDRLGIMQIGAWMILSPFIVFLPIICIGLYILKTEQITIGLFERIRLKKISKSDWKWTLLGLLGMTIGSGITFFLCNTLNLDPNPPFSRNVEPWTNGHHWMFLLWAIYWPINILGEGFVWRGVILPRLEKEFKNKSWIISSVLWGIFHLSFGVGNLIVLLPTLIFVPFITYKTGNTWTGILLHAILSGPGFIILALGLMS